MGTQKKEQIFQSFKRKKRINYAITILVFAVAFFAFWYTNNKSYFSTEAVRTAVLFSIWGVTIGGLIAHYINWRCPACKKHLGGTMNPQSCRKCGIKLR